MELSPTVPTTSPMIKVRSVFIFCLSSFPFEGFSEEWFMVLLRVTGRFSISFNKKDGGLKFS